MTTFDTILTSFYTATGMMANHTKSTTSQAYTTAQESDLALQRFPYNPHPLDQGFKYLGYWIKPTGHKIADWTWLITKLENRISHWSHRFLSRVGRLVLIKSVLEATPVFWMALDWIPRDILALLRQSCCRYLWNGRQDKRVFAWISQDNITLPKKWGG